VIDKLPRWVWTGGAGAFGFFCFAESTLYGPAVPTGLCGLAYVIYRQYRSRNPHRV